MALCFYLFLFCLVQFSSVRFSMSFLLARLNNVSFLSVWFLFLLFWFWCFNLFGTHHRFIYYHRKFIILVNLYHWTVRFSLLLRVILLKVHFFFLSSFFFHSFSFFPLFIWFISIQLCPHCLCHIHFAFE